MKAVASSLAAERVEPSMIARTGPPMLVGFVFRYPSRRGMTWEFGASLVSGMRTTGEPWLVAKTKDGTTIRLNMTKWLNRAMGPRFFIAVPTIIPRCRQLTIDLSPYVIVCFLLGEKHQNAPKIEFSPTSGG